MVSEKGKRGRPDGPSGQQNGGANNGQKAARTPNAATASAGTRSGGKGGGGGGASLRHISPIPLRESSEVSRQGRQAGRQAGTSVCGGINAAALVQHRTAPHAHPPTYP
jgi:hypothetical protein